MIVQRRNIISIEEAGGDQLWDEFIVAQGGATFCHLARWRRVISEHLGAEPLYRVLVDQDGRWEGVLPLFRVRSQLFGHYLVSLPYLNYGGPLGRGGARRELASWAVAEAQRSAADLVELRDRQALEMVGDDGDRRQLAEAHRKLTVVLDLPASVEAIWRGGFTSKLRSQIRRPLKEGMEVSFGLDQVSAFYEVFSRNMRDLGTPVLPLSLFEALARHFPGKVLFSVVYHGDRPVAAGCGFVWGGEYEMTWASSLREYNRMAPNMLLYWSVIERMIGAGVERFNFGRCTPGGGTHRFKLQWGGQDIPLPWQQWSPSGLTSTPSPERPVYQLASSVWRRLPLTIANVAGPSLARRIP